MTELWRPDAQRQAAAQLTAFLRKAGRHHGAGPVDYAAAHVWSIADPDGFWSAVWDDCGVIGEPGGTVFVPGAAMRDARFFPDAQLNFAENLMRRPAGQMGSDPIREPAIIALAEGGSVHSLSRDELLEQAMAFAAWLRGHGVCAGDRVAAVLPNIPQTVAAMLGCAAIGAVFSSASPDFGEQGLYDRFAQIEPVLLLGCDGYCYNGRQFDVRDKILALSKRIPSVRQLVWVRHAGLDLPDAACDWSTLIESQRGAPCVFERFGFDHPLYIVFSSGTTGAPKCIVHRAGGVLLQHLKEHRLQCDIRAGDRVFYFTTCGWMMWNWLVSALASDATLLLYDGSPVHPDENVLFDFIDEQRAAFFGVSARYLDAVRRSGLRPCDSHRFDSLRTIASTGSPLMPEAFDFVYEHIRSDVLLASISGGTDILSCFVGPNPCGPVHRGEIQAPGLGMAVEVWNESGERVVGETGELVCTRPFPSMPLKFWNDPDGAKYQAAYFKQFPDVWCHGDFIVETGHGGYRILGRSDAVLNPGGVRIGTAEIYRPLERIDEITDAVAVGQDWHGDQRVLLFVVLRPGIELTEPLEQRIRDAIRQGASPRHVPAKILAVPDIPRTRSGKISERAVRDVIHGREVANTAALENPDALGYFERVGE